jgi:hypothetical protein
MKIKGFNDKEQKCYDVLADGEQHTIAEMKKRFLPAAKKHCEETYEKGSWDDGIVDAHAQSFVRNSIRRLIRDGWAEKKAYGTYQLTRNGKKWVADGKDTTASFGVKRGRKPGTKVEKKAAPKKASAKKETKKAAPKKAAKTKAPAKPKTAAKPSGGKQKVKAKTKAKPSNGKSEAQKKAKEAHKRAARDAAVAKAQQSIAEDSASA